MISFCPHSNEPFRAGANVVDGRFTVPKERGLTAGRYKVRINASVHDPTLPPPPTGERDTRPGVEIVPSRYNAASELIVDVHQSGSHVFDFDLQSQ